MTISEPKSNEEEISLRVRAAIEKIDKVEEDAKKEKTQIEADANKKKTQIVQDLAKDLEGKIAADSICNEIVHQLRGKVSETLIRRCLDGKYKEKHRVANARKQKKKHESTDDLAAPVPLNNGDANRQEEKKVVMDTSGNETDEQEDTDTKEETMLRDSLDDDIAAVSSPKKDLTATKKEILVSHISMPFEDLRKDMATTFRITKILAWANCLDDIVALYVHVLVVLFSINTTCHLYQIVMVYDIYRGCFLTSVRDSKDGTIGE